MLEPLRGSAFADSITSIKYDGEFGVPDVVREWAAVFPNVETLELCEYTKILDECALASVIAWPRLRWINTEIDETEEEEFAALLPALAFAYGNGRRIHVYTGSSSRRQVDKLMEKLERTVRGVTGK